MAVVVERFDIHLINLDPTLGSEIRKTRPCVIVSPNEMNRHLLPVIVAPMTSSLKLYPTRVNCTFQAKRGQIVLDQIRAVDRVRLVKRLGKLTREQSRAVLTILAEMFAE